MYRVKNGFPHSSFIRSIQAITWVLSSIHFPVLFLFITFFFFFAFEDSDGDLVPWLIENKRYGWIYDIYIYKKKLGEHGWLVGDQYTRYNAINVKGVLSAWHNIWSTIAGRSDPSVYLYPSDQITCFVQNGCVFFFKKKRKENLNPSDTNGIAEV